MTSDLKSYNKDFKPKEYLKAFFTKDVAAAILEGAVAKPLRLIAELVASGHICGDNLIDASLGPLVFQLFPLYKSFNNMFMLDTNKESLKEIEKWKNKDKDAHNWGFAAQIVADMADKSVSAQEIEDAVRSKMKYTGLCDFSKKNPASPKELPEADCLISFWLLDSISKDYDDYKTNLKHMTSMIKSGGYLILVADMDNTYYVIGNDTFSTLKLNETFVKTCVANAGCEIMSIKPIPQDAPAFYNTIQSVLILAKKK